VIGRQWPVRTKTGINTEFAEAELTELTETEVTLKGKELWNALGAGSEKSEDTGRGTPELRKSGF
jgi:hypothetical protein